MKLSDWKGFVIVAFASFCFILIFTLIIAAILAAADYLWSLL